MLDPIWMVGLVSPVLPTVEIVRVQIFVKGVMMDFSLTPPDQPVQHVLMTVEYVHLLQPVRSVKVYLKSQVRMK